MKRWIFLILICVLACCASGWKWKQQKKPKETATGWTDTIAGHVNLWRMQTTNATITPDSWWTNDLTIEGATPIVTGTNQYNEVLNGFDFDGTNDALYTDNLARHLTATCGAVCAWFYLDGGDASLYDCIFSWGPKTTDQSFLYAIVDYAGALQPLVKTQVFAGAYKDGAWEWSISTPAVPALQWVHLVLLHDGAEPLIYTNAVAVPRAYFYHDVEASWLKTVLTDATADADRFAAGILYWNSGVAHPIAGQMRGLRIYTNYVPTATEITNIMVNTHPTNDIETVP